MARIVVGKQTLESLTAGMYTDPRVIYREFIQNAVDSIDNAYANGILKQGEEHIEIFINPIEQHISVQDNGLGVLSASVVDSLVSIGNSSKSHIFSRGFRGIGRLAALSYCDKLIFTTTALGENIASKVTMDAKKLTELLSVSNQDLLTAEDVLQGICTIDKSSEDADLHYFKVDMIGVAQSSELLNINQTLEYIEQVAPLHYNESSFPWGKEICGRLFSCGYQLPQYNICLTNGAKRQWLYKPYQNDFVVDRVKELKDTVNDIQIHELKNSNSDIIAIAWIAKTNYRGSIWSQAIKGIRVRKGNILIGDAQTLNVIFKDARFNGWSIGEVFALDPLLLPNARRDNFEKNVSYFMFSEQMTTVANEITRAIRSASANRNAEVANALKKLDDASAIAQEALNNDIISGSSKNAVTQRLNSVQQELHTISTNDEADKAVKEIAFDELDMIIGKIKGVTSYRALNAIKTLSSAEKKIIERVFNIIKDESNSSKLIDKILYEFSK